MAKSGRISIGTLCVVVAVVALDFAWWRHITGDSPRSLLGFRGPALDAGAMPMASLLAIGYVHARSNRGRISRRFFGFALGGLVGLLLYLIYNWACLALPQDVVYKSMEPIYQAKKVWPRLASVPCYLYFADIAYYGTPQLLLAAIGGLICWKDRTDPTIVPEPGPVIIPETVEP